MSSVSPALAGRFFTTEPPGEIDSYVYACNVTVYISYIHIVSMHVYSCVCVV